MKISASKTLEDDIHVGVFRQVGGSVHEFVGQDAIVVHFHLFEDFGVVVSDKVAEISLGFDGQRAGRGAGDERAGAGTCRQAELFLVELIEIYAELRAVVVFGHCRIGGHDATGHVEKQRPRRQTSAEHTILVGNYNAVGGKDCLVVVASVGACGDFFASFGECFNTHATLDVELFGRCLGLYTDAFILRTECEGKHGETEKKERLDHLHCGKTV